MFISQLIKRPIAAAVMAACGLAATTAQATTTPDPGDYTPAPAGTTLGLVYLQRLEADDVYANGRASVKGLNLGLDLAILRSVAYFNMGGHSADWQVILPMAHQRTQLTDTNMDGVGDLTVGGTVWTLEHPDKAEYLGWSAFLTVPTGAHETDGFAVSNDRYALDLQAGYTRSLGGPWSLDLVGQVELYTKSRDERIKTDPLYRAFASVRRAMSDKTFLELIVRQTWGQQQDQSGIILAEKRQETNVAIGINTMVTQRFQMQVQLADDVHVEDGPRFKGLQTRFAYIF